MNDDPLIDRAQWRPGRILLILLLGWSVLVLAVYFRQAWALLAAGPGSWVIPEFARTLRDTGVPYAGEALWRAVTAMGAMAIVLASIGAAGRLAMRWLWMETLNLGERLVIGYSMGAGLVSYALLALAAVGLYRPAVVAALLAAAAALSVVTLDIRSTKLPGRWLSQPAHLIDRADLPWAFVTIFAIALAAFCALAPEFEHDALSYHLELPRRWLAAGGPVDDVTEYVSLYPLTWELLFGGTLALDGAVAARLLHWTTLPFSALGVVLLARRVSAPTSPWLAAAVFVTGPTVFWEATTAYVDLALALHVGVGVYALLRASGPRERRWLVLAGLQFGLAAATKHLGLVALASALIVFAVGWLRDRPAPHVARACGLVLVLALIVPSPWYARAWVASGNPVFPELYGVFGAKPDARWNARSEHGLDAFKQHFGRPRTAWNVATLPWDMTMHAARYAGTLGPLLLAFLPLGIVAARSPAARGLLAGSALYVVVWISPLSSYQLRFLVPVWATLSPLIASGMQLPLTSDAVGTTSRLLLKATLTALLLVNLPPMTPLHEGDRRGWSGWLTHVIRQPPVPVVLGGISQDEWLREQVRSYAAWQWLDANTPVTAKVLTFFGGDHFYTHRPRLWSESVTAHPVTWGAVDGSGAAIRELLHQLGITYVLAPSDELMTGDYTRLDMLARDAVARNFERAYADRWTVVYGVRSGSLRPGASDQR